MRQQHAQDTTNVHQIIHVMAMCVKPTVIQIKTVWLMSAAYAVHVNQFVTVTHRVATDKYARIVYARSVAATI